jgi:hypothetical protein
MATRWLYTVAGRTTRKANTFTRRAALRILGEQRLVVSHQGAALAPIMSRMVGSIRATASRRSISVDHPPACRDRVEGEKMTEQGTLIYIDSRN